MSSQINGFKIVRAVSGVSSIQQSMQFFNRCYPVRFHSYFKRVGSLFPFQACLLVQVGCTGLANIWSKTGVLVAEGQIHGEKEEVKGDQYLIPITTSKCSMCSDHMQGSRFAALSPHHDCFLQSWLQHRKEKSSLRFSISPSIPSCSSAGTRTSSTSPSSAFLLLVQQIHLPHEQQLWLPLQLCWHLG